MLLRQYNNTRTLHSSHLEFYSKPLVRILDSSAIIISSKYGIINVAKNFHYFLHKNFWSTAYSKTKYFESISSECYLKCNSWSWNIISSSKCKNPEDMSNTVNNFFPVDSEINSSVLAVVYFRIWTASFSTFGSRQILNSSLALFFSVAKVCLKPNQ